MEEKTTNIPVLTLDPTPVEEEKTQPAEPVKSVEELIVANSQLSPEEFGANATPAPNPASAFQPEGGERA